MAGWIRPLYRDDRAPSTWHLARDKSFTTTTFCGEKITGPLETTTSEDKPERDGRCATCVSAEAESREQSPIGSAGR